MSNSVLKDVYKSYFKIGVACERITEKFTTHEIGNPDKEKLISSQFNSMTFANELKPAYNMAFMNAEATNENLPFEINPSAKAMLDWAKKNHLSVRGHVLVWHSQCAKEVFCKDYVPVTIPTDPELLKERPMLKFFEKLDPVCFVDRETMLKRLRSYIFSLMDYMYKNGYAKTIYAWDVVNEAIELADKTPTGLRNSYWYQVIGDDFIYFAFKFAKEAVVETSKKYAHLYGIDAADDEAIKNICPKLFYNDYNEWMADKKAAIIGALTRETEEHGSVIGEGLIDGIGMQGHLSDNSNIDEYIDALKEYSKLVDEVHITELDVKSTCANANQEYYQAVFYKKLFEELINAKKEGANLTSVTIWGLTDDNSWIRGANPLLFRKDLSNKLSFDALVYAVCGGDLGEPEKIICNLSDRFIDFENVANNADELEKLGFKAHGFGQIEICDSVFHSGTSALANEKRFGAWSGINMDVSDFIGQTIRISAWVKSPADAVTLNTTIQGADPVIASAATNDEWAFLETTYKIPSDVHSMNLYFATNEHSDDKVSAIYIDEVKIELIGLMESFEDEANIAAIRGAGHLPVLYVTDKESVDGKSHSLCVTRQEKDATVKFDISSYIGKAVDITVNVKTTDKLIKLGLDGAPSVQYVQVDSNAGEWTKINAKATIPEELNTAAFYVETEGNADYFIDDIVVTLAK